MVQHLVAEFWNDVEGRLVREHGVAPAAAHKWVSGYRHLLRDHRIGGTIYNRGEQAAVEAVRLAIKAGRFPPDPDVNGNGSPGARGSTRI